MFNFAYTGRCRGWSLLVSGIVQMGGFSNSSNVKRNLNYIAGVVLGNLYMSCKNRDSLVFIKYRVSD